MRQMREEMHETIVHGCAYGLRDTRTGLLMKKAWRICSTDNEFAQKVGRHCSNRPGRADNHEHLPIENGQVVAQTAFYPPAMGKAWAKHIMQKNGDVTHGKEIFAGLEQTPEDEIQKETEDMPDLETDSDDEDEDAVHKGLGVKTDLTKKEQLEIDQKLSRLHRNLGHPSNKTLYKILKASGAALPVLRMARQFQCHGCQVGKLPKAVRVASGIEVPAVLEVLASDGLEWLSPTQTAHIMTLNLDEGSGLTSVTYHGQKGERSANRTASEVIGTWESWSSHYRKPSLLRLDPEGCHCAQAVAKWTQ